MPENEGKVIFAYWALRGKPHTIRLLMEYLAIPYQEFLFKSPKVWQTEGKTQFTDLPCLQDGDFKIFEVMPIITYILKKYNHANLLGNCIEHIAYVQMYMWSTENLFKKIVSSSVKGTNSIEQLVNMKQQLWKKDIQRKLLLIEQFPLFNDYYLGYISVVDFDIYQMVHYLRILFPGKVDQFKKIVELQKRITNLPGIKQYVNSDRGRTMCLLPVQMVKKFKSQHSLMSPIK